MDAMPQVLRAIDAAAFDDALFPRAVERISELLRARTATFWAMPRGGDDLPLRAMHRIRPSATDEFFHYWHMLDPWSAKAREHGELVDGLVAVGSELVDRNAVGRSAFYNEWAKEHGMHAMLSCVVAGARQRGGPPESLACFYRPAGEPEFDLDDKALVVGVLPRLQAALEVRRLRITAERRTPGQPVHEPAGDCARFVLDREARVLNCNAAAARLLEDGDHTEYSNGRLLRVGSGTAPALQAALQRALQTALMQRLVVTWPGPPRMLTRAYLTLLPERAGHTTAAFELLVELIDDDTWAEQAAALYGLTAMETRVCRLLCRGATPEECAERLALRMTTIRTHIRHAMQKADVSRITDLVRLLAGLRL
jgi:DNA-binding CsgD family transcriptional regulator